MVIYWQNGNINDFGYLLNFFFITSFKIENIIGTLLCLFNLFPCFHLFLFEQSYSISKQLRVSVDVFPTFLSLGKTLLFVLNILFLFTEFCLYLCLCHRLIMLHMVLLNHWVNQLLILRYLHFKYDWVWCILIDCLYTDSFALN